MDGWFVGGRWHGSSREVCFPPSVSSSTHADSRPALHEERGWLLCPVLTEDAADGGREEGDRERETGTERLDFYFFGRSFLLLCGCTAQGSKSVMQAETCRLTLNVCLQSTKVKVCDCSQDRRHFSAFCEVAVKLRLTDPCRQSAHKLIFHDMKHNEHDLQRSRRQQN